MLSLNGESGILFLMNAILNYDATFYTSTLQHRYQQVVSFRHTGKEK